MYWLFLISILIGGGVVGWFFHFGFLIFGLLALLVNGVISRDQNGGSGIIGEVLCVAVPIIILFAGSLIGTISYYLLHYFKVV